MSAGHQSFEQLAGRPTYTASDVASILRDSHGIVGQLRPLPSERDQNFLVLVDGSPRWVAKIANSAERQEVLELQYRAMEHLAASGIACPVPVEARDGSIVRRVDGHLLWVVTFLPGELMAARGPRSEELLANFGAFLGAMTCALADFDHPAASRHLPWDVAQSGKVIAQYLPEVAFGGRPLVERALQAFETTIWPALSGMPHSVIHNDANDHNVLIADDLVTGIIDFGDMVRSITLNELAVGSTYAALGQDDPLEAIHRVTTGYSSTMPLSVEDANRVPELVRTRLATSLAMSAHQHGLEPDNDYLVVSQRPAWHTLAALDKALSHD